MPKLCYYTVTQTRKIRISATNTSDAAALAERVFSKTMLSEDQINVEEYPIETLLTIKEDSKCQLMITL